ncbi:MAG TPA: thioredoxin TrxA [Thiotrichales bacterium]|nr:thioredoxin TrxA [Thiotrichales bacterium]
MEFRRSAGVPPLPCRNSRRCGRTARATDWRQHQQPGGSCKVSNIVHVTDETFQSEVLESSVPVLVDYWADWCGPCKMIAPILDEIASEYDGRLKVAKLNIDENQDTPRKYGIRGIPTLMLFKNGNVEATKVGALSKSQLTAFLDSNL